MASEKNTEIWKILKDFNFEISESVPERLKCVKCKKILRNASQISCGCQFCLECIEQLLSRGLENCIGNSEECVNANLSNYFPDFKANKEIMKLMLKCPKENCAIECVVMDMVDHLRLCQKQTLPCLFNDFGCVKNNIEYDRVQEHFLTEQESHNKIILEMILALKNEIVEKEERSKMEVEILKNEMNEKEERSKMEFETLKNEMKEKEERNKLELEILRNDLIKKEEKIKIMEENSVFDSSQICCKILSMDDRIKKFEGYMNQKLFTVENTRKNLFMKTPNLPASFEWKLNNIRNKMKGKWIDGDSFYIARDSIEVRLRFCNCGKYFNIDFGIYYNGIDGNLFKPKWPIQADVTMGIMSLERSVIWDDFTKNCTFEKPIIVGFSPLKEPFQYFFADYPNILLANKFDIIIKCLVSVK